jgi:hypothetical protein
MYNASLVMSECVFTHDERLAELDGAIPSLFRSLLFSLSVTLFISFSFLSLLYNIILNIALILLIAAITPELLQASIPLLLGRSFIELLVHGNMAVEVCIFFILPNFIYFLHLHSTRIHLN